MRASVFLVVFLSTDDLHSDTMHKQVQLQMRCSARVRLSAEQHLTRWLTSSAPVHLNLLTSVVFAKIMNFTLQLK